MKVFEIAHCKLERLSRQCECKEQFPVQPAELWTAGLRYGYVYTYTAVHVPIQWIDKTNWDYLAVFNIFKLKFIVTLITRIATGTKERVGPARGWAAVTWKWTSFGTIQAWTPGVTWSVTWCYLECYLVLPGVSPPRESSAFVGDRTCRMASRQAGGGRNASPYR